MMELFRNATWRAFAKDAAAPIPTEVLIFHWHSTECEIEWWRSKRGEWQLHQSRIVRWPSVVDGHPSAAISRGEYLSEQLLEAKIECKTTIVCIPGEKILQKRIDLPAVDDSLLADTIALQLESRGITSEAYISDYVVHQEGSQTAVYCASAPRALISEIRDCLTSAGLSLRTILLRECALTAQVPQSNDTNQLLLIPTQDQLQCIVSRQGKPLASASFPLPAETHEFAKALDAATHRLLRTLPNYARVSGFNQLWCVGPRADAFARIVNATSTHAIQELLAPIQASLESWACIASMLSNEKNGIDFCSPKRGPDTHAARRKVQTQWAVRGALVAALLLILVQFHFWSLERSNRQLETKHRALQSQVDSMVAIRERASQLQDWKKTQLDIPNEIKSALQVLPDNTRAYVQQLRIDPANGDQAELRIEGVSRELEDVFSINQRLLEMGDHYQVQPAKIEQQDSDAHYQTQFAITAHIDASNDAEVNLDPRDRGDN